MRASFFRFVLSGRDELIPCNIRDVFRQMMVFLHIFDIQIL